MNERVTQGITAAAMTLVGAYFHQLIWPVTLLIVAMILDYATGMTDAWIKHELSSKTGIVGILKKLGYMVAICVAIAVDFVMEIAAEQAGLDFGLTNVFALLVTIWLLLNECLSILENLNEMGVPIPGFLLAIIRRLKKGTEEKGGGEDADRA